MVVNTQQLNLHGNIYKQEHSLVVLEIPKVQAAGNRITNAGWLVFVPTCIIF